MSATPTVKKNCPVAVGVPLSVPLDANVSPGGRNVRGASVHVSVPVPPLAVNGFVYAVPTFPAVRAKFPLIEIVVTVSVNCRSPYLAPSDASVACTRNVYAPSAAGLPVSKPSDVSAIPGGRMPSATDQAMDGAQHANNR